jgi:hypothetical protein
MTQEFIKLLVEIGFIFGEGYESYGRDGKNRPIREEAIKKAAEAAEQRLLETMMSR